MARKGRKSKKNEGSMARKGRKSEKNEGSILDEPKTSRINVSLTPTGYAGLKALAVRMSSSINEIIERLGR